MHGRKERALLPKGVVLMLYKQNMNPVEKFKKYVKTRKSFDILIPDS